MIKLIIFDFDGVVIIGSNDGYFACYHKALEAVGVKLDPEEERRRILAWWGKGYQPQLEHLLQEHSGLLPKAIEVYEYYYYKTDTFTKNIRLVPGARETLAQLAKSYTLAIASGMMQKTMNTLLTKFDLPFFRYIMSAEDVPKIADRKPAPYMLRQILAKADVSQEEAMMLGDAENDVQMAQNAGIEPVVVLTGHLSRKEAEGMGVKYIIEDVTKLESILA
jgi:HAD superfamily hydrolase (TIGR01662 family)